MPVYSESEKITNKLSTTVWQTVRDYHLIQNGDLVMVCLSGGKDSYTMLDMLIKVQQKGVIKFDIVAVNLDQKQPGFPEHILPEYLQKIGVNYKIVEKDTYSIVMDKVPEGKTMCSLCSRLRRGTLYETARDLGATKIALGHHKDDVLETLFLNMFFSGKLETMPPKYLTDDKQHVVIRPLVDCKEKDIITYSEHSKFPIIPCNLCGSQEKLQRKNIKKMLNEWETEYPDRKEIIFNAISNVSPSHLMDTKLYDFENVGKKE